MSYAKKLPVGSLGICHTAIANNAWGEASIHYIPPQAKGQWELGTYQIHALENIRENRDIIIVSANNGAIEHTPQELKYMTRAEIWQRVDEDHPLPVTAGSRAIIWVRITATAIGNTTLVTPTTGTKVRVHYFSISNAHAALADVAMRFAAAGALVHQFALAAQGGLVNANLTDANWEGAINEVLFAFLTAAYAGGVYYTIGYSLEI